MTRVLELTTSRIGDSDKINFDRITKSPIMSMKLFFEHERALFELGRYDEALKFQIQITKRNNDSGDWYTLSVIYDKLGEDKLAINALDTSLSMDSSDETAWFNKACFHARLKNTEKAISCLLVAIALGRDKVILDATADSDFDNIRSNPEFKKLLSSHSSDLF